MILDEIRKYFNDCNIRHIKIKAKTLKPASILGQFTAKDTYGNNITFEFTEQGVGCLQWLWRGKKINDDTKEFLSYKNFTNDIFQLNTGKSPIERKIGLANFINRYNKLCDNVFGDNDIVTLHLFGDKNSVRGITRKYNFILDHDDILDLIEENGYSNKVVWGGQNGKAMQIDLSLEDSDTRYCIRIQNGFTGHENLSYRVVYKFHNYYHFESNLISKNRHLKKMQNTLDNLNDIMQELSKNNLSKKLSKINYSDMSAIVLDIFNYRNKFESDDYSAGDNRKKLARLSEKQVEKLSAHINYVNRHKTSFTSSFEYIHSITSSAQHGEKTSVEILMNAVLNEIFDGKII